MMKVSGIPASYLLDDRFTAESEKNYRAYNNVARHCGLTDANCPKQLASFATMLDFTTGKPLGRVQANRTDKLVGFLWVADTSVNNYYASLSESLRQKFMRDVVGPTMDAGMVLLSSKGQARVGAGGAERVAADLVLRADAHPFTRSLDIGIHGHITGLPYVLTKTGFRSGSFKHFFDQKFLARPDMIMNLTFSDLMQRKMNVEMGIDPVTFAAVVRDFPRTVDRTTRNAYAQAYLKARGLPVTPISMEFARQNTRPEKPYEFVQRPEAGPDKPKGQPDPGKAKGQPEKPYEFAQGPASGTEQSKSQPGPDRSKGKPEPAKVNWFAAVAKSLIEEFLIEPLRVFRAANRASKKHPEVFKVNDLEQFLKDAAKPTRKQRHRAAIRAVRRTWCESLHDALKVASKGYRELHPKIELEKGTRVNVYRSGVQSEKQLSRLMSMAKANGWNVHVIGRENGKDKNKDQERGL